MLHENQDFDAQLQRTLNGARFGAADLGEAIATAGRVAPGDYDQWYDEWQATAKAARQVGDEAARRGSRPLSGGAYLRASEYWRQSYFFLRHDLGDRRLQEAYQAHRECFRQAVAVLDPYVEAFSIPFDGAPLAGYFVRRSPDSSPRPTVLMPSGFDSTAEELYKLGGRSCADMGWNVVVWDGPGQGELLIEHGVPMRPDFEVVLEAVVDWVLAQPEVKPDALFLLGRSLGGYLAPRGASEEHRLAGLICDPGQLDFTSRFTTMMAEEDWQKVLNADPDMDAELERFLATPHDRERWGSRMAAMGAATFGEWLRVLATFTLEGRVGQIRCPTLVTDGEGDFASQSTLLFDALQCPKRYHHFPAATGAGGHCEGMGQRVWEAVALGWIDERIRAGG